MTVAILIFINQNSNESCEINMAFDFGCHFSLYIQIILLFMHIL